MKKIINGRKYDTDTAKVIASYSNEIPSDCYFSETLYQKHTKEFFVYGHGGAMSKYAETCYGSRTDGETIIPLSLDEAKEWVATYSTVEIYETIFGEVAE